MRKQTLEADVFSFMNNAALQEFQNANLHLCLTNKKNMDSRKCWKLCSFFSTKNAMRFRGSVEESCVNCCEEGKETNDETGDQIQWQGVGTSRGASETVKC